MMSAAWRASLSAMAMSSVGSSAVSLHRATRSSEAMRTVRAVSDRRCVSWGAVLTGNEVSVLLSSREAGVAPRMFRYALGRNPFIMTWLW